MVLENGKGLKELGLGRWKGFDGARKWEGV